MATYKVVVDGSNIATEGRTMPSLAQLDEAVRSFIEEHPGADVLVIVDSTFPNRIDSKEHPIFEAAYMAGEIITPPAGTIGRGDAFILKVADKLGATIFSNDSFQEFHGSYDWLFDKGRLVGGKPIPGLGWVFTGRNPVRGPKSREAVREAKRTQVRIGSPEAMQPMPVPKSPPPSLGTKADDRVGDGGRANDRGDGRRKKRRGKDRERGSGGGSVSADSIEDAVRHGLDVATTGGGDTGAPGDGRSKRRKRRRGHEGEVAAVADAVNEPLTFITFIAAHGIGTELSGAVATYSSHGVYIDAGGARCYAPLSALGTPLPRSARDVVQKGTSYPWRVVSFDSARRGIELALAGPGTPEVVAPGASSLIEQSKKGRRGRGAASVDVAAPSASMVEDSPKKRGGRQPKLAIVASTTKAADPGASPKKPAAKKKTAPAKNVAVDAAAGNTASLSAAPVKKRASAKKTPAKKGPGSAPSPKGAPSKGSDRAEGRAVKSAAGKSPVAKSPVVKSPVVKSAPAKSPLAKKLTPPKPSAVKSPVKKAPVKKAPVEKSSVGKAKHTSAKNVPTESGPKETTPARKPAKRTASVANDAATADQPSGRPSPRRRPSP